MNDLILQFLKVFGVLGVLALVLWQLKRGGFAKFAIANRSKRAARQMELIDRLPLSAQHSLHLVRCMDRTILVAISPAGCQILENPAAPPAPQGARS
jgi:flagellar biogenesis protein FliO